MMTSIAGDDMFSVATRRAAARIAGFAANDFTFS